MNVDSETICVNVDDVKRLVRECVMKVGANQEHAQDLSDLLVTADLRGHFSHGINRLGIYVNDLKSGSCSNSGEPTVEKQLASTALVNGNNVLGPAIGKFCMNLAIEKAKETGIGMVTCHQSNHYGIAGYYALMAAQHDLIGMSFTNATPSVLQPRSSDSGIIGTNPISFATPVSPGGSQSDQFVLDMATSTVAHGKVEVAHRKGQLMPRGWGADADGNETDDPERVLRGGGLLPLGGSDETGGYKGYGLAMMVEILCAALSGATFSKNVRKWGTTERQADLGQCFVAIDPSAFAPGFGGRLDSLVAMQRQLAPSRPDRPVMIAGDPERRHVAECERLGGIPYPRQLVQSMNELAESLSVHPMKAVNIK